MNKIQLPEAIAEKYELATAPGSDRVFVGKPVNKLVIFSKISAENAEELSKAGKYLKVKGATAEVDKNTKK